MAEEEEESGRGGQAIISADSRSRPEMPCGDAGHWRPNNISGMWPQRHHHPTDRRSPLLAADDAAAVVAVRCIVAYVLRSMAEALSIRPRDI